MAEFPALPLWTDAYLSDTRELSTLEHGAYLLLLMTAWRTGDCSLPDDDRLLARWAGLDRRTWARVRPVMERFWTISDGRWTQKRLAKERAYVNKLACARREIGHAGGVAKALKNKGAPVPTAQNPASKTLAPTPTPTPTPTYSVAKATGADAPPEPSDTIAPTDPVKLLFDAGVALLGAAGVGQRQARALLGKWRRDHGDEAVIAALGKAKREGAIDPVSFITKALEAKNGRRPARKGFRDPVINAMAQRARVSPDTGTEQRQLAGPG